MGVQPQCRDLVHDRSWRLLHALLPELRAGVRRVTAAWNAI